MRSARNENSERSAYKEGQQQATPMADKSACAWHARVAEFPLGSEQSKSGSERYLCALSEE